MNAFDSPLKQALDRSIIERDKLTTEIERLSRSLSWALADRDDARAEVKRLRAARAQMRGDLPA